MSGLLKSNKERLLRMILKSDFCFAYQSYVYSYTAVMHIHMLSSVNLSGFFNPHYVFQNILILFSLVFCTASPLRWTNPCFPASPLLEGYLYSHPRMTSQNLPFFFVFIEFYEFLLLSVKLCINCL